jgi:hypothetical protein
MTDLIERAYDTPSSESPEVIATAPQPDTRKTGTRPNPLSILLAVVLGCDALLLMANVGHLAGGRAGVAIVVSWLLLAFGVANVVRPVRVVLGLTVAAGALGAGTWLLINSDHRLAMSVVAIGLALSAVVGLLALLRLLAPSLGATWSSATLVLGSIVPVGLVVVTTAALFVTPPAAFHASSSGSASAGIPLSPGALALKNSVPVPGQNSKAFQQILAGNASERAELKPTVPLNPADQAVLTQQLTQAYQAAEQFPTVATAKAAGMILAGGMAPGVGAHYQVVGASDLTSLNGTFDPSKPASWIYASTADNAPVVGVMYESLTAQPPSGFIGPNDVWHRHANVCIQFSAGKIAVPFAADQDVSPQECADVHGQFLPKTVWMVHAWVVPGWGSPQGVFSHDNLHVYCPGNTDLVDAIGFCTRQQ